MLAATLIERADEPAPRVGGVGVGLAVTAAWWAAHAVAQAVPGPHPIQSLRSAVPSAGVPKRVLFVTERAPGFDRGLLPGAFVGSLVAAALSRERKFEGLAGSAITLRCIAGALPMAFGSVTAAGCAADTGLPGAAAITGRLVDQRPRRAMCQPVSSVPATA